MEKGKAIKWTLVLVAIIVIAFAGIKIFASFSTTKNIGKDITERETIQTSEIKEFNIIAKQWEFSPDTITVNKGDKVKLHIKSIDVAHGFALPTFGIDEYLEPGKTVNVEFVADKTGTFSFACSVYCGQGHGSMIGTLIVK